MPGPPIVPLPERSALGPFGPMSMRGLWHLVNAPRDIDGRAIRVACLVLVLFYAISAIVRPMPGHPEVWGFRGAVIAYGLAGALWGPRFTWAMVRAYTLGVALLIPTAAMAVALVHGNPAADLALTALAIFVPLAFVQTAVDIAAAVLVLGLAAAAVLATEPPAGLPLEVAGIVLGGALISGGLMGLVLIAFRGRVAESTAWWQGAAARERTLREFSDLGAPQSDDEVLADELADRFRSAFGSGRCAILVGGGCEGDACIVAVAGGGPMAAPDPEQLDTVVALVSDRQPRVYPVLDAATARDELDGLPWLDEGGMLVLLPIVIDERVQGVVALSTPQPRAIGAEDLLLWQAMASQVGVVVGSVRLFARLQEALRARSEFVDTMSHEMRSPLHVIIGYADMLADDCEEPGFVADRIRTSALELLQLVENTLAVAPLGTGKLRLELTDFDLIDLVDELRESTRALPEAQHAVAVSWEVAADLSCVRLDRLKLKEIVHNLVSNALKFTERGAVTVSFSRDEAQLRIDVEDTGAGVPSAAHARIFEMFERGEFVIGARAPGVGLGLYIVRKFVELMDGRVTLASELGQGSRFSVRLPLRLEASSAR